MDRHHTGQAKKLCNPSVISNRLPRHRRIDSLSSALALWTSLTLRSASLGISTKPSCSFIDDGGGNTGTLCRPWPCCLFIDGSGLVLWRQKGHGSSFLWDKWPGLQSLSCISVHVPSVETLRGRFPEGLHRATSLRAIPTSSGGAGV